VLSARPKITELNFHLFGRNVHPELFDVCASRTLERENYWLQMNITTDGHCISFLHDGIVLTEVSASAHHPLPKQRVLLSQAIDGASEVETCFLNKVSYRSSVQLECVPPTTFATIKQQLNEKVECEGLIHRFESNGRLAFGAISYVNVQAFRNHIKVRSFHTFPETCAVVKSDSLFSLDLG
jgi:hypothetical protein